MANNKSLDFLNMIKNNNRTPDREAIPRTPVKETISQDQNRKGELKDSRRAKIESVRDSATYKDAALSLIAVIDTETNWRDEVMSLGVAVADAGTYRCMEKRYYILDPECRIGGMYSNVMYRCETKPITTTRDEAIDDLRRFLDSREISKILAYNARFDLGHLPELVGYDWYDIMRLAAYRQYNPAITQSTECCKTGRLKGGYGVERITRMLTGDVGYCEVHNAIEDAVDELRIVELLGHSLDTYECAKI